jgi:hypothetical protein
MTEFDDYKGLFAENGDFDIPAMLNLGLSFKVRPDLVLAFDWQRIFYNEIAAVGQLQQCQCHAVHDAGIQAQLLPGW